jgi:hypothetical protein
MTEHSLKSHPQYFAAILSGSKMEETRVDDRDPPFAVGDIILLREWNPATGNYTGRQVRKRVVSVTPLGMYGAIGFVSMKIEVP